MLRRRLDLWIPSYLLGIADRRNLRARRRRQLTHVLFMVCDHYEPRHGALTTDQVAARLGAWQAGYRELQDDCERQYGLRPLHTFFYPPHHGIEHMPALARMAFEGLGEVELHYHHSGDTSESLRANLDRALHQFHRAGLLVQAGDPPIRSFGFIHGDWALDNSAGGAFCGVNDELTILQELGCWGDLTMPSANLCQTRKINSIYYAVDDPERPKSHDWGEDARVGSADRAGLLMIQGPLAINLRAPRYPRIENASLTTANWGRPDRIRSWLDCHVHVRGRPEWLFVKLHTHGAIERDFDALFGEKARAMHRQLARELNDGHRWRLHYVTARQAYNVIKAAEDGLRGDPAQYLDYRIGPQATAFYCADRPHEVECCTAERLVLREIEGPSTVRLRGAPSVRASTALRCLRVDHSAREIELQPSQEREPAMVVLEGPPPVRIEGARVRERSAAATTLECTSGFAVRY